MESEWAEASMAPALEILAADGVRGVPHVRQDDVPQAIVRLAEELGCDQTVMGTRGLGSLGDLIMGSVATNVIVNTRFPAHADSFPFVGASVWVAILAATPLRRPEWGVLPDAAKGSLFLLSLVVCASMMPVERLPEASWETAFGLGFVSAVFDNIPLTALALSQGGYDWGMLAYAVGFGGSMIWFGSSAGVALSNLFPEARSVGAWLKAGWYLVVSYVLGFFIMLAVVGWHPPPSMKAAPGTMAPAGHLRH